MDRTTYMTADMRTGLVGLLLLGVAACAPAIPESVPGGGFGGFDSYGLAPGTPLPGSATVPLPPQGFDPAAAAAAIDRAEGLTTTPGAPMVVPGSAEPLQPGMPLPILPPLPPASDPFAADRPRGDAPSNIAVEMGEMVGIGGISDEQDFSAVAQRETIESDAERLQRNRANYQLIEPTALPERPSDTGPNIVQYALTTSNSVGQQAYARSAVRLTSPQAACGRYASADQAQEAFLAGGGPNRDGRGLDPDGDGFACDWDPGPFRAALN